MTATTTQVTHQIGAEERRRFAEDGWLLIPGALPHPLLRRLTEATDRVYAQEALGGRLLAGHRLHLLGFVDRDDTFLELLDPPSTFPYVWGLLGWNVYAYHCHLDVNPTVEDPGPPFWGWHQDGGRQNLEIESEPRPRLAVKVAYVLSDMSRPGRGNTRIIPGSHLRNRLPRPERPELGFEEPEGAVEVLAKPGDAFVFDRRLWHSRSVNTSGITRKIAFVGYTYRWVRPREELALDRDPAWWEQVSPVRRQLLGHGRDTSSFWGLGKDTYPLKETLAAQGMLDPSIPPQR